MMKEAIRYQISSSAQDVQKRSRFKGNDRSRIARPSLLFTSEHRRETLEERIESEAAGGGADKGIRPSCGQQRGAKGKSPEQHKEHRVEIAFQRP